MRGPTENREEKLARIGYQLEKIHREHQDITERLADLRAQFHELEIRKVELDQDMDQVEQELVELKK